MVKIAWNKGLTKETDERVRRYAISGGISRRGKSFVTLEGRKKLSLSAKAYKFGKVNNIMTELKKNNIRKSHLGKHHSEETKIKIGLAQIGDKNHLYGKKLSDNIRNKISLTHSGDKNHFWKGGLSYEIYPIEFNPLFKRSVRKRDNHICMLCGYHQEKLSNTLSVHHINYDKQLSILPNCISLCKKCHGLTGSNRTHWTNLFQEKLSKLYGYQYQDNQIVLEAKI